MEPDLPRQSVLRRMPGFDVVRRIATRLAAPASGSAQLLAVGSASYEPWHLVAHMRDSGLWGGSLLPPPTLVRHAVPDGAPPHLAVDLDRLRAADHSATVLLVTPDDVDEQLLERLADARRRGSTVLAVGTNAAGPATSDLNDVAHEVALVTPGHFEVAQHVIPGTAIGSLHTPKTAGRRDSSGWRPFRFAR